MGAKRFAGFVCQARAPDMPTDQGQHVFMKQPVINFAADIFFARWIDPTFESQDQRVVLPWNAKIQCFSGPVESGFRSSMLIVSHESGQRRMELMSPDLMHTKSNCSVALSVRKDEFQNFQERHFYWDRLVGDTNALRTSQKCARGLESATCLISEPCETAA